MPGATPPAGDTTVIPEQTVPLSERAVYAGRIENGDWLGLGSSRCLITKHLGYGEIGSPAGIALYAQGDYPVYVRMTWEVPVGVFRKYFYSHTDKDTLSFTHSTLDSGGERHEKYTAEFVLRPTPGFYAWVRVEFNGASVLPFQANWVISSSNVPVAGSITPSMTDSRPISPPYPVDRRRDALEISDVAEAGSVSTDPVPEPTPTPVPPPTFPTVSEYSSRAINQPEYVVTPGDPGGLVGGTRDLMFLAHWDMGRGDTGADAGTGFTAGTVLEYAAAYLRCTNSSNMSYFNMAIDDLNDYNRGRIYVSAIDSWKHYPRVPDFGAPANNIHVHSRYFFRAFGFMSGVARDPSLGRSGNSPYAGRLKSAQFTETVVLSPNMYDSDVTDAAAQNVTRVTGWKSAPFTYDRAAGVLKYFVGF